MQNIKRVPEGTLGIVCIGLYLCDAQRAGVIGRPILGFCVGRLHPGFTGIVLRVIIV